MGVCQGSRHECDKDIKEKRCTEECGGWKVRKKNGKRKEEEGNKWERVRERDREKGGKTDRHKYLNR